MFSSDQEILKLQQEILLAAQTAIPGTTMGGQAGSTITVTFKNPIGGRNYISAIAWTTCTPGAVGLVQIENGTWYALSPNVSTDAVRESIRHRQHTSTPSELYPIKILFSVDTDTARKFYVGGDRLEPFEILTIPLSTVILQAAISNTGKRKNDWIAGINYKETTNTVESTIATLHGDQPTLYNWQSTRKENNALKWRGWGYWNSPAMPPDIKFNPPSIVYAGYPIGIILARYYDEPIAVENSFTFSQNSIGNIGLFPIPGNDTVTFIPSPPPLVFDPAYSFPVNTLRFADRTVVRPAIFENKFYNFTGDMEFKYVEHHTLAFTQNAPDPIPPHPVCGPDTEGFFYSYRDYWHVKREYSSLVRDIETIDTQMVSFSCFANFFKLYTGKFERNVYNNTEHSYKAYPERSSFDPGQNNVIFNYSGGITSVSCRGYIVGVIFQSVRYNYIPFTQRTLEYPVRIDDFTKNRLQKYNVQVEIFPGFLKEHFFTRIESEAKKSTLIVNLEISQTPYSLSTAYNLVTPKIATRNATLFSIDNSVSGNKEYLLLDGIESLMPGTPAAGYPPTDVTTCNLSTDKTATGEKAFIYLVDSLEPNFLSENTKAKVRTHTIKDGTGGVVVEPSALVLHKVKSLRLTAEQVNGLKYKIWGCSFYPIK